jgi:hypothetical protein
MNEHVIAAEGQDLCLFMVAGEHSGDALGAKLMAALNEQRRGRIRYLGVGGEHMAAEGLVSQFPIGEVAVMGIGAILGRLPRLLRRVYGTAAAAVAAEPHAVVIIDSPEFTLDRAAHSPAAAAHPDHRPRIAQRFGRGAGRAAMCVSISITCWPCCPRARRAPEAAGPPAPTSAIR